MAHTFGCIIGEVIISTSDPVYDTQLTWSSGQAGNDQTSPVHQDFNAIVSSFTLF